MATESTSTAREMPEELFKSFSAQFDALTQAIEDAGFPVLHTCQILRGETDSALSLSSMSAVRDLRGETAVQMAAAAAAQPIMAGVTAVLKDETGDIPPNQIMQLIPLTKEVIDVFISFFTQAMAEQVNQVLTESSSSGDVLMKALMSAVENLWSKE